MSFLQLLTWKTKFITLETTEQGTQWLNWLGTKRSVTKQDNTSVHNQKSYSRVQNDKLDTSVDKQNFDTIEWKKSSK